jgi:hypothetical protein
LAAYVVRDECLKGFPLVCRDQYGTRHLFFAKINGS